MSDEKNLSVVPMESTTLLQVISRAAADPSTDVEKMERLMQMYERIEGKRSETAFNDAMCDSQARMRPISADANNPQTRSKYASYGQLDKALRPIYTSNGFSLSFDTGSDAPEGFVKVLCYVSHKNGHSRTYHLDMPSDGKGAKGGDVMTKTHAVGSGMSYGMRYLLKMIFNVAVGEDDQDGNDPIPPDGRSVRWIELAEALASLDDYKIKKARVIEFYGEVTRVPANVLAAFNTKFIALKDAAK